MDKILSERFSKGQRDRCFSVIATPGGSLTVEPAGYLRVPASKLVRTPATSSLRGKLVPARLKSFTLRPQRPCPRLAILSV